MTNHSHTTRMGGHSPRRYVEGGEGEESFVIP